MKKSKMNILEWVLVVFLYFQFWQFFGLERYILESSAFLENSAETPIKLAIRNEIRYVDSFYYYLLRVVGPIISFLTLAAFLGSKYLNNRD